MTKFNPDFWETTIDSASWGRFSMEDGLWYQAPQDVAARHERIDRAKVLLPQIEGIMREVLTDRQREVVRLYFLEQLNQRQIAERMGVSQQSVSEHLYGKVRDGRAVGGAIRKLQQACAAHDLRWP